MDMDRFIGRLLDNRYEILEVIGTGGMAVVYKARCHRLNRLVAIKILKDEYSRDEEFRRRFHAESQAVAMLSHPNIVSVYDVSTSDEADYIVMELIDGITLKQYMEKKGVLNWKETLHFAIQIAKALEHAHSRGIIHRDIKPHNVMVLKNGSVKVADFGIARIMSKSNTLTKEALGSVHYISPEQAKGGRVDNRSDIYSLGVVMYEMMTGRPPYDGESPVAVAIQHINGKPTMPSVLNPNIPGGLEQIIMRAMAQNPADRFPTVSAMLADMDEFRKEPTILFDYNNPVPEMDAAARLHSTAHDEEKTVPLPTSAAERAARTATGAEKPHSQGAKNQPESHTQKPAHRREEIVEEEEERSKVATIAVVACAVVAVAAIIIFIIAIANSGSLGGDSLTTVPNLLGQTLEQAAENYTDIVVTISDRQYSDTYDKDEIMGQSPASGSKVVKGGTVTVTVSLGAEPQEKVMELLTDVEEQQAVDFLTNLDMDLQIITHSESSSTVAEGCVTRTDPVEGETLSNGQTVHLWISTGPDVKTSTVPNVLGYSADMAAKVLSASNFNNISYETVASSEEEGTVVSQSVASATEVDVTTLIVLEISDGSLASNDETTAPTEEDTGVEKVVLIEIPEELAEDCVLCIWSGSELVLERNIYVGTVSVEIALKGEGTVTYIAMFDNVASTAWTFEVNFDE